MDALAFSHPLSRGEEEVTEPAQISEMFSTISYSKVCSSDNFTQYFMQVDSQKLSVYSTISPTFADNIARFEAHMILNCHVYLIILLCIQLICSKRLSFPSLLRLPASV